jgi:uncharacterized protein (DUF952 family)
MCIVGGYTRSNRKKLESCLKMSRLEQKIFHIVPRQVWQESRSTGEYRGDTLETEGFIHCSTAEQVVRTANRIFLGREGLIVLQIDPTQVISRVVYEDTSSTGEDFPHIYGPLNVSAVQGVQELGIGVDGSFKPLSTVWSAP